MPNDTASPNPSPQPSPDPDLRAAIADLEARVRALEARSSGTVRQVRAEQVQPEHESRFGLTAINRIGAVTLAIGIVFFFKYAAENQWIGAGALIALGLLTGLALIAAGEWLRRGAQQAFAQGLAGCGVAILYISIYAAFGYYKLIPREFGFLGLIAASALALALCFRFESPAIAAVGFIGGWIAPLLVPTVGFRFAYLCALTGIAVLIPARLYLRDQSAALFLVPFNAFWALLAAAKHSAGEFVALTMAFAALHFVGAFAARQTPRLFAYLYVCGHACLVAGGVRAIDMWAAGVGLDTRASFESATDSVFLALYGVVMISYGLLRRSVINRFLGLAFLAMVIIKLYLYDVWQLTRFYRITALFALGVLLLAASYLYSRFKQRTSSER